MLSTYPSRTGSLSASFRGRQLHSSFNPDREADRFVEVELPVIPRTVIAVGPGLGYIIRAILRRNPDCRVIAMFLSSDCHRDALEHGNTAWHPGAGPDPAAFLESAIDDMESASLTVVEWPPTTSCFSAEATRVRSAVAEVVHQHHASLVTEGANGRRWLSNLVRNFTELRSPVSPILTEKQTVSACVVAAAGPTLEEGLRVVERIRSRVSLWVVGSALEAVISRGLTPDVVISTDAAVYAAEYLRAAITRDRACYPFAAPLTASRGITDSSPVWLIHQNDPVETMIFGAAGAPVTRVPAHGTVTGTALSLALSFQPWPVIVTGMDFAWRNLLAHARPHVAEVYRDVAATRLVPPLTSTYRHSRTMTAISETWHADASMRIYSRWFERMAGAMQGRLFRLLPSPAAHSVQEITTEGARALPLAYGRIAFSPAMWPGRSRRIAVASEIISTCIAALEPFITAASPGVPDPLQSFLLRRLALDGLIRWHRSGDALELGGAAAQAKQALESMGGIAK